MISPIWYETRELRLRNVVRAQTAWLALGLAIGLAFQLMVWLLIIAIPGFSEILDRLPRLIAWLIEAVPTLAFPICLGIAITRYRLFDIEIIVRRTLVYSLLKLTPGLVYVGCVIVSRTLIAPLTGGSELAIVDPGDRGAVQLAATAHPDADRQALLPAQVRRGESADLQSAIAPGDHSSQFVIKRGLT